MERLIDDSVKQKLLDSLAEEPTMVISTAYAYAKNYVMYGEDITKAWTTAVQQASILDYVRQKARVEAYDSFKKDYQTRLKADMVAMLTDIQLEIEEKKFLESSCSFMDKTEEKNYAVYTDDISKIIQQKIDALKAESKDKEQTSGNENKS